MPKNYSMIPVERIESAILFIRGHKVLLDADLARLYGVSAKRLNEAVRRNRDRFPDDFIFQLTSEEFGDLTRQIDASNLRSQFATSSWGGRRYLPYAFTEQGVAMLSSVLRSKRAIQVNVEIMRAFVRLRRMLASNEELARKLAVLERSDLHRLFDRGYVTVTPDYQFRASRKLKEDFDNGEVYLKLTGTQLWLPADPVGRPNREFLDWHAETVFRM